nr:16S rRNA (cytidine(1402)-2'-O)-methyltransferase [Desulfobulbaceae bacterium]
KLQSLAALQSLLVFYESPHRLLVSLKDCLDVLGDRNVAICKELTKIHEKCLKGKISNIIDGLGQLRVKGEYVVLIEENSSIDVQPETQDLNELLLWYKDSTDKSLKDSVKALATDLGLSKSKVYAEALKIWDKE